MRVRDRLPIAQPTGSGDSYAYTSRYRTRLCLSDYCWPPGPVMSLSARMTDHWVTLAYSSLMELLQTFPPGLHPGPDGRLWSSAGALFGGLLVTLLQSRMR